MFGHGSDRVLWLPFPSLLQLELKYLKLCNSGCWNRSSWLRLRARFTPKLKKDSQMLNLRWGFPHSLSHDKDSLDTAILCDYRTFHLFARTPEVSDPNTCQDSSGETTNGTKKQSDQPQSAHTVPRLNCSFQFIQPGLLSNLMYLTENGCSTQQRKNRLIDFPTIYFYSVGCVETFE